MYQDTIYAPITALGNGSIYTIRISGDKTIKCLNELGVEKKLEHRKATLFKIKDKSGELLDEALLLFFKSPYSFTGEDICEISLHCSQYIINEVFDILSSIDGVRFAERGEFSRRAFLNNKFDLLQAESIADLVNSKTKLQHKKAIEQLVGKNSDFFSTLRDDIINILSNTEALIDFPEEEDIKNSDLILTIVNKTKILVDKIERILDDNKCGEKINKGLDISIIGNPNVGKSTFLNFIAKKDIAIVSNIAGTTRDIIQVSVDIAGIPTTFSDTAGIRETDDVIESEGVRRAITNAKNADFRILILEPDNILINDYIKDIILDNTIILLNKSDMLKNDEQFNNILKIYPNIVKMSLKYGTNTDYVLKYINTYVEKHFLPYIDTGITHERYRIELKNSLKYLNDVIHNYENIPIEIISENIRLASNCICKIIGEINTNDILDNIFSKFCIGK